MHKVEVPINYRPNLTYFYRNDRKRWQLEYDLPHEKKVRMILTLPKETADRSVRTIADEKNSDLIKGLLTEKEFQRIAALTGSGLSISEGIQKYLALTALEKGRRAQIADRTLVVRVFSYFMSTEMFLEAKRMIEDKAGAALSDQPKRVAQQIRAVFVAGENMKAKALKRDCGAIGNSFTHFREIEEKHIFEYRTFLLAEVEKRKAFESAMRPKLFNATEAEVRQLMRERAQRGMAPMTAKSNFVTLKKVFQALEAHRHLEKNPALKVPNITLTEKDSVRSSTPTQEQINKILTCEFQQDKRSDFPIKEFLLFAKETGAREGEILHLEWPDIVDGVWRIRSKPNCPTRFGMGWAPKWMKERDIVLSPVALRVLDLIPKASSVGYISKDPTPYPANFIFTCKDRGYEKPKGQRRRTDKISKHWKSLLRAAGVPCVGLDKIVIHDLRRFKNMENKHVKNMSLEEMCRELGNSAKVNQSNYKGEVDPAILEIQAQISKLQAKLLEYQGGDLVSVLGAKKNS